jgi:hypothetical protein
MAPTDRRSTASCGCVFRPDGTAGGSSAVITEERAVVLIVVVVLLVLARLAKVRDWPGAALVERQWASARPFVVAYVRGSPATFLYLLVLSVTTWVLLGLTDQTVQSVLTEHSTNLEQLRQNPVRVLIRSAFWADGYLLLAWLVLFALVLAPAERWLGTVRWLVVFVAGHVGATLVTAAGLWLLIGWGKASPSLEGVVDVGVSYGFAAVAAVFTYRLPAPGRWLWAAGLLMVAVGGSILGGTFTDFGHLAAVVIGFSLYPITRSAGVSERGSGPVWRPPMDRDQRRTAG